MESPATDDRRKPLRPRNSPATALAPKPKPIQTLRWIYADANKENQPIPVGRLDASLAEELGAVRRRRERLRWEKERTEMMLRERDLALERGIRELEMRGEEQLRLELELLRLIGIEDRGSFSRLSPFQSLREREEERRKLEINTNKLQEEESMEKDEKEEEEEEEEESSSCTKET